MRKGRKNRKTNDENVEKKQAEKVRPMIGNEK